jgi:ribonuclease BN (tRNA processing enzyme)
MPPLTLTILGAGPAAPNPGGACSGYLVRDGESAVIVDCGSGVAGRVALHYPPSRVAAITISHLHPDHYFDLVPLYYVVKFGGGLHKGERIPVHVPPGGIPHFNAFNQAIDRRPDMLADIFDIREYTADRDYEFGSMSVRFFPVQHYILSHAARITGSNGSVLVFSGDVAPCDALVDAARDADVLLCESALMDPSEDSPDRAQRGHTSAAEAGEMARQAGVRRLILTHYRSGPEADAHHHSMASRAFGGRVDLAREGDTYTVG